jgi:hypothetical protein
VKGLIAFYEPVLELKVKWWGEDYAEFATGVGVVAFFSASACPKCPNLDTPLSTAGLRFIFVA